LFLFFIVHFFGLNLDSGKKTILCAKYDATV
jgi:hypothetical protein